ncbi:MAG: hypothetical protein E7165_03820 [Firmicutes bacterium]|nr:hypothetical protein [Bacillota bacterium]
MANKVVYNNTDYDILDAITLLDRNYLILINGNSFDDINYLESSIIDGQKKYFLPPKSYDISNSNYDLKRLQLSFVVSRIVNILKYQVENNYSRDLNDIKSNFVEIKKFLYNDTTIQSILNKYENLKPDTFLNILEKIEECLNKKFLIEDKKEYNYLERPIKTDNGLDYEWLYDLNLSQLRDIIGCKNRTSEELIYILDALDKKEETYLSIQYYTELGKIKKLKSQTATAAFVDVFLLTAITASFALLFLLSIF